MREADRRLGPEPFDCYRIVRMHYVDLSRRFRALTAAELEEPELLAYMNESNWTEAIGWPELLKHPRVLLLAEAGSGKTEEMREQARRLSNDSKPAFFIELESLDRASLWSILSPPERGVFEIWRAESEAIAWFFLDAVDELKIARGTLDRALRHFSNDIDGFLQRAHVVISCRPSDWRPASDMAMFKERLPLPPVQSPKALEPDQLFLAALRERRDNPNAPEKAMPGDNPHVVVLLPLSDRQIIQFAQHLGVADAPAFFAEIQRRDATNFARRPLDLTELIRSWRGSNKLGTRSELHDLNIMLKLRIDPDKPDSANLSEERACDGAERIALALALTKTRTIRSPEHALDNDRSEGVLDTEEILSDWTPQERRSLLRRALFDPATYGRVRFHHRSVQEYLAARRLRRLREAEMSAGELRRLLFADCYGVAVVIPTMRAIAAWLALWDDDVRRELMAREPETLLSMGDPEALPIAARAQLLRAYTRLSGAGGWRGEVRIAVRGLDLTDPPLKPAHL